MNTTMIANRAMTYGTRRLRAGDEFSAPRRDANLLGRLGRARLSDASPTGKIEDAVKIPTDWRGLGWPVLKSLAAAVSPTPVKSKDDAVSAIEAELKRRGA